MAATAVLAGTDPARERASRERVWRRAFQHYNGIPPKPLVIRSGEADYNVIVSFGALIVDKSTNYLFGKEVTSEIPKGAGQQTWLDECWRRNKRGLTLSKLATNGGVTGQVFAKLVEATGSGAFPRVVVLDTQTCDVVWSDDDCEDVQQYIITNAPTPAAQTRQLISLQDDGTWQIADQQMILPTHEGEWETTQVVTWQYDFAPIVTCQNLPAANSFWGKPDLSADVLHILGTINRLASKINKIIDVHAHPKTYAKGMGSKAIRAGTDDIIYLPSAEAEIGNLEMQSDLSASLTFLDRLLDYLSFITHTPKVALGAPDQEGALSGVAMQLRYAPLVEKTEVKRRTYGDLVQELDRRLLAMGGFGDVTVTQLHWPDLLPSDPLQARQVFILDDSLGVSTETILTKLGYDPKLEAKRRLAEQVANTPPALQGVQPGQAPAAANGQIPPPGPIAAPLISNQVKG